MGKLLKDPMMKTQQCFAYSHLAVLVCGSAHVNFIRNVNTVLKGAT